jgi:5-methylcytosine-specific restriction enzyme subunit McrC
LNEVWQNRPLFFAEDENEEERKETTQRFFIFDDGSIKPRNYVGFLQYEDLRINVYPRVFNRPGFSDRPIAIQNLLKWLSYCNRIHFPFTDTTLSTSQTDDWLEAFIYLFGNFTEDTLSQSPHMAYEEVTEEMNFLRGRIAMPQYISQSLSKGRHHTIHCIYEPFVYDNLFNRIVKHTCRLLLSVTESRTNKEILNNVLFLLDEVSDVYCSASDCEKVKVNRLYPAVYTILSDLPLAFFGQFIFLTVCMNISNQTINR